MSNYTKATNFTSKDALTTGDANKVIKGADIDNEYIAIAAAITSKSDLNSPTFTGTPTLPTGTIATTQTTADSSTNLATTAFVQAELTAKLLTAYPVGSIYINAAVATNPATLISFLSTTTWVAFGAGRVPVGFNSANALFDTVEETGGSADSITVSHTHTWNITDPGHTHGYTTVSIGAPGLEAGPHNVHPGTASATTSSVTTGITAVNAPTGSPATNTNYQPYITVYMWKRTV